VRIARAEAKKAEMESETIACDLDLSEQSKSWDWHVRRKVAWNTCTPEDILRQLARDEVQWVREAVAGNGRSPRDVLIGLAGDQDGFVRASVALNERTPSDILDDLAADEMMDYDYILNKNRYLVKEVVARNPNVTQETLRALSSDGDKHVRASAASNPEMKPELLAKLSKDSSWLVRDRIARNERHPRIF
jgi:hypothetical protein